MRTLTDEREADRILAIDSNGIESEILTIKNARELWKRGYLTACDSKNEEFRKLQNLFTDMEIKLLEANTKLAKIKQQIL